MLSTVPCACKTNRHCRSSSEQRTSCEKWRTRYQYSRSPWVGEALPQTISNCLTLTELHINFYVYNFSFTLLHFRLLEMPLKNIGGEGLSPKKSKVDRSFVFFFVFVFFFLFHLISCGVVDRSHLLSAEGLGTYAGQNCGFIQTTSVRRGPAITSYHYLSILF